ncbi:MAG: HAD-IC family P-type ATPase, partial [Gemmatimonadota bacterium]|nr:HAD-IC family P-type ATPase [Gemmatimonadota bacterium]
MLAALRGVELSPVADAATVATRSPLATVRERRRRRVRARIVVRGLYQNPDLGRQVVERLERRAGVRAQANPLTGRVLVEFENGAAQLDELISDVSPLESLAVTDGPTRAEPPEADRLRQNAARAVGAALGLGLLTGRRLLGASGPPVAASAPAVVAGAISLVDGFPALRDGARRRLGPETADVLFSAASIVSLTLAGGTVGLALSGLVAARVASELMARRAAWRRHEAMVERTPAACTGTSIRLEAGERPPLPATVAGGFGIWTNNDGLPITAGVGDRVPAGAPLLGGPCVLTLDNAEPVGAREPRPIPPTRPLYDHYVRALGPVSLAYAGITALLTRSPARTFSALLLVNPRAALIGAEAADSGTTARVLRAGVTIAGTRTEKTMRLPDALLLDCPRVLTEGLEVHGAVAEFGGDAAQVMAIAAAVADAAGAPWSAAFRGVRGGAVPAEDGRFDGKFATARCDGVRFSLRFAGASDRIAAATRLQYRGDRLLLLRQVGKRRPLGVLALRPRLSSRAAELVRACREHGVRIAVIPAGDPATAQSVAERAGVALAAGYDAVQVIRNWQRNGELVAFVADSPQAAPGFLAADLAIALTDGQSRFADCVDLLAPDLGAVACVIEAGARRRVAVRDSVALSAVANVVGAVWGLRGQPGVARAALAVNTAALAALAVGWARLRGGARAASVSAAIADPRPERWGRQSIAEVLRDFETSEAGLSSVEAVARRRRIPPPRRPNPLLVAALDQIGSPLTGILAAGAGLSLFLGSPEDAVMIVAMLVANAAAGMWQELRTGQAAEALGQMNTPSARVLRDGRPVSVPADEVVPGDALLLARGDRVAADARLVSAHRLEVDEAALTGESLPVAKAAVGGLDAGRVVLAGSGVILGTGQAVVIAVGPDTRMGAAIAAMAAIDPLRQTPLTTRLHQMLRQVLPVAGVGGGIVALSGLLRREPAVPSLALGASVALAAVPEGLPLLASLGEAAVARRLAVRNAIVRRPSAVEALGRVDIVCTDKTGTMTAGRLALALVADIEHELRLPADLPPELRQVLLTAALAGPHPDAPDADVDPTDAVVNEAAGAAGLGDALLAAREAEQPFESARLFHASVVERRLCAEGAAEALAPR